MKARIYLLPWLASAVLFSGCGDACEGEGPVFTTEEMQWLPEIPATQKALFRNASGDTVYLRIERAVSYPKAYIRKGGNTVCPDEQAATGDYRLLRKSIPGNGAAFMFEVNQQKRKSGINRTFYFQVPNGFSYTLPRFTSTLDSITLNGVSFTQVELFDATRYNDSLQLTGGNHLRNLYFKKGIGVVGYESVQGGVPDTWNLQQ